MILLRSRWISPRRRLLDIAGDAGFLFQALDTLDEGISVGSGNSRPRLTMVVLRKFPVFDPHFSPPFRARTDSRAADSNLGPSVLQTKPGLWMKCG